MKTFSLKNFYKSLYQYKIIILQLCTNCKI